MKGWNDIAEFVTIQVAVAGYTLQAPLEWRILPFATNLPLLGYSTFETLESNNGSLTKHVLFRVPFVYGIEVGNRVKFRGGHFVVRGVAGASDGGPLEIRCEAPSRLREGRENP